MVGHIRLHRSKGHHILFGFKIKTARSKKL